MAIGLATSAVILSRMIGVRARTEPPFVVSEWLGDDPVSTPSSGPVVLTRARLGSWSAVLKFMSFNRPLLAQLKLEPGLVGLALRANLGVREFWTLSAWRDENSMRRFVASPAHLVAVRWLRQGAHDFESAVLPPDVTEWSQAEKALEHGAG